MEICLISEQPQAVNEFHPPPPHTHTPFLYLFGLTVHCYMLDPMFITTLL